MNKLNKIIEDALISENIEYQKDVLVVRPWGDVVLDFYMPARQVYIMCAPHPMFNHSDKIGAANNIIYIQGTVAAEVFAAMLMNK